MLLKNSYVDDHLLAKMPILDCRQLAEFCQGHLRGAGHIPAHQLPDAMHLLPDTSIPLRICGHVEELRFAQSFLTEKGYQVVASIVWQAEMAEVYSCQAERLWQPSPLVIRFVADYADQIITQGRRGLDVACGAGRDAVYLATQGWTMLGVDYRQDALLRVASLAHSQSVQVVTQQVDLEASTCPLTQQNPQQSPQYTHQSFDLITVARYLHRPLLSHLQSLLAPQGVLLYHTFMQGSEQFGSPKNPNYLLRPHELASLFDGYHIWCDEVIALADGRPMSYFIAQKRS